MCALLFALARLLRSLTRLESARQCEHARESSPSQLERGDGSDVVEEAKRSDRHSVALPATHASVRTTVHVRRRSVVGAVVRHMHTQHGSTTADLCFTSTRVEEWCGPTRACSACTHPTHTHRPPPTPPHPRHHIPSRLWSQRKRGSVVLSRLSRLSTVTTTRRKRVDMLGTSKRKRHSSSPSVFTCLSSSSSSLHFRLCLFVLAESRLHVLVSYVKWFLLFFSGTLVFSSFLRVQLRTVAFMQRLSCLL